MKLNSCCFCINLRTGSLIIGWLELIAAVLGALGIVIILAVGSALASGAVHAEDVNGPNDHIITNEELKTTGVVLIVTSVIVLIGLIVQIAFTITLLVGISKNKRGHVKAYLIYTTIFLILGIVMFFVSLASDHSAQRIVGNIVGYLLAIYFLLVVKSYYHQMDTRKPAVFNAA